MELKNPYNFPHYFDEKLSALDIKAKSEKGESYDIEVQIADQSFYRQRALFYWSGLYSEQIGVGGEYQKLKKSVIISCNI